ncbi:MAG: hypothetical protein U0361_04705 [Nitrospiraceae bacterium]
MKSCWALRTARTLASSFAELKRAQNAQQRLEDLTFSPLGVVEIGAATMEADHAARMQWVMGHSIINGRDMIRATFRGSACLELQS